MTAIIRNDWRRFLAGGLVAATGFVAGCGQVMVVRTIEPPVVPPVASKEAEAVPAEPAIGHGEVTPVNVFGELDGAPSVAGGTSAAVGFQQHTILDEGADAGVGVDPTGNWLVFSSTRHSEHSDIYLQKVGGASIIQLTSDPADDAFPTFSPDGKQIAFCSNRTGNWDIYLMDLDGKNVTQVTSSPMQEIHPSFSPDGTRLVYSALGGKSAQWEVWTANLSTNERRMVGVGLFPVWSPDRTIDRIAFQRARQRGSRWFSLWTAELVDGEARRLTEVSVSANAAVVTPAWSADGKRLAFGTIIEPAKGEKGRTEGQQDIWTVNSDGTNRSRLTDGAGVNATPCWGRDGRVYFISDRGGKECVWSVRADSPTLPMAGKPEQTTVGATDARPADH